MARPYFHLPIISSLLIILAVGQSAWSANDEVTIATIQLKNGHSVEGKIVYDGDDGIKLITSHGEVFYTKESVRDVKRQRMNLKDYHIKRGDYWANQMLNALNDKKRFISASAQAVKEYKMALVIDPDMELPKKKLAYVEAEQEEWRQRQIKIQLLEKAEWEAKAAKSEFRQREAQLKLYAKQMKVLEEQRKFMKKFPQAMKEFGRRLDRIEDLLEGVTDESDKQLQDHSNQIAAIRRELFLLRNSLQYFGTQYNIIIPWGSNK